MTDGECTSTGRLTGDVVPAVDAASVLLVRDGPHPQRPLEVLLLERHLDADFAGGALVFPGGKVAPADRALDAARWTGPSLSSWVTLLGAADHAQALGLLVAAVRETFEEVGVLLALREDGRPLTGDDLTSPSFVTARRRLARRDETWDWSDWLSDEELVLDLWSLSPWSWWVTPEGQHRRFDTRFLVARQPAGQEAVPDDVEATALRWWRPADALAAYERAEVTVVYPTRANLRALMVHVDADAARAAAEAGDVDRRRIQPRLVRVHGRVMVQHPDGGDPEPI